MPTYAPTVHLTLTWDSRMHICIYAHVHAHGLMYCNAIAIKWLKQCFPFFLKAIINTSKPITKTTRFVKVRIFYDGLGTCITIIM